MWPERPRQAPDGGHPALGSDAYARWRVLRIDIISEPRERRVALERASDVCGRTVLEAGGADSVFTLVLARLGAGVTGIESRHSMCDIHVLRVPRPDGSISPRV